MSHPFTQAYVKMISAASEIQELRLKDRIFEAGEHVLFESPFIPNGSITTIDDRSTGVPQENALAWLPQLHQLMELMGGFSGSLEAWRRCLTGGAPKGYLEGFKSWDECALALLMLERFHKKWNGTAWIELAKA